MRKCMFLFAAFALFAGCTLSPSGKKSGLLKVEKLSVDNGTLKIQFWLDDVVRVTYADSNEIPKLTSLSVVETPSAVNWKRQENDKSVTMAGPRMKVIIDKQTGAVSFLDLADKVLLRESAQGRKIQPATQRGVEGTSCTQSFDLSQDEGIYGLGQHQRGDWNYNSGNSRPSVRLAQANMEVAVPVITSSKGYVLLWDNPAVTTITVNKSDEANNSNDVMRWSSEYGKAIDYYFCYDGGTASSAMKAYRHLTGDAPLMPKWELGFWQCKERYNTQEEILGVAEKYRELKVPVDGIIQDWQYWPSGNNTWGSHKFDPARYPDPNGMFKELHDMNYHTLISVWPKFDPEVRTAGNSMTRAVCFLKSRVMSTRRARDNGMIRSAKAAERFTGNRFATSYLIEALTAGGSMRLSRK